MIRELDSTSFTTVGRFHLPVTRGDLVLCAVPIALFLAIVSLV